jgi:hypothetical protein
MLFQLQKLLYFECDRKIIINGEEVIMLREYVVDNGLFEGVITTFSS